MAMPSGRTRLLYLVFFISGMSALIYETVWLRILIRVLGCTVYATSTVLGAFMAGLALGSYLLGRYADRARRLLRVYALLELGIGLTALAIPFVFSSLVPVYRWFYSFMSPAALSVARASLVFICLVVPASLMGGTLPVLIGFLARERSRFAHRVGSLYGVNTLGAVLGVVGAGFIFIGRLGELNTMLIAVGGNVCAAAVAFYLDSKTAPAAAALAVEHQMEMPEPAPSKEISPYSSRVRRVVIAVFAVSGFVALAYEVVWMRVLQLFLQTSIYAFSVMLAVYLTGVALGSLWGRRFVDRLKDPIFLFAALEILIAALAVVGLALLAPMDSETFRLMFGLSGRLLAAVVVVLPITLCLGILFPTVSRCFTKSEGRVGESIGQLYAFNTIGCIVGSLICGFLLIPLLGTSATVLALAGVNVLLGLVLFLTDLRRLRRALAPVVIAGGLAVTILGYTTVRDPFFQIVRNRVRAEMGDDGVIYLHRENAAATITAFGSKTYSLKKRLWLNGQGMTVLVTEAKLMAHLPILLCDDPKDVLVVCFGMGTTLRSAVAHEGVAVDTVELVPATYDAFGIYHPDGPEILKNPRVHQYVDDGRNFLLMRDKKYDVITIDPAPPIYSAGTVNLYSREFIALCRDRLNAGGVLCLWVPPAPLSEVHMIVSTFQSVFPHASMWRGTKYAGFYLIGTDQPLRIPMGRFRDAFDNKRVRADILEWNDAVASADALAGLLTLNESELAEFVRGVPVITDDHPYTEFPFWRRLLNRDAQVTYDANDVLEWKQARESSSN